MRNANCSSAAALERGLTDRSGALLRAESVRYGELVGVSTAMKRLVAVLRRLEKCVSGVLIEGETGTGKELVARAIHQHSPLHAGPFVAVNCGALQRELVQSELFGHVRGAFTGAIQTRPGAFSAAHGGSLFLDEVAELPLELQPILLRALEERTIVAVGENRERSVNVRVLAATNSNLARGVERGTFRRDLYHRLAVVKVPIPPLRERPDDIDELVRCFIERVGGTMPPASILTGWRARDWLGNARELRNAVEAYQAIGEAPPASGREGAARSVFAYLDVDRPYHSQRREFLAEFRRAYVLELLARTQGNVAEASRRSGIERSYLNKLAQRFAPRPGSQQGRGCEAREAPDVRLLRAANK